MDPVNPIDINKKLDKLITAYEDCKAQNRQFQVDSDSWRHERQRLLAQNELARNKIAEMIARLKHLEFEPN